MAKLSKENHESISHIKKSIDTLLKEMYDMEYILKDDIKHSWSIANAISKTTDARTQLSDIYNG